MNRKRSLLKRRTIRPPDAVGRGPACFFVQLSLWVAGELLPQGGFWKENAGVIGGADLPVEQHFIWRNLKLMAEGVDKLHQPPDLRGGEGVAVAVPHQADPDGLPVIRVGVLPGGMSTRRLIQPTLADRQLAIVHPIAVPNDKVITQASQVIGPCQSSGVVVLNTTSTESGAEVAIRGVSVRPSEEAVGRPRSIRASPPPTIVKAATSAPQTN